MSVVHPSYGHHYMVAAGHEYATGAAYEVLEAGGNAIDAGVAAILCLGVVYSDQVSIAGVAPMMIHLAETDETFTLQGLGGWPSALDVDSFITRHQGEIPLGVRRTVVPAAPDAYLQALERWGTMRFSDVAVRAIQYARDGFPRHQVMVDYVKEYANDFRHFPDNVDIWFSDGKVPTMGTRFIQTDLARTLEFLCDEERTAGDDRLKGLDAVRKAFYRGDIASQIVRHQKEQDGFLSAKDLEDFSCRLVPSEKNSYRLGNEEVEIHTCGAWSQGPILLEALSILDGVDLAAMKYGSCDYFHVIAEALKLSLGDREAYVGDPEFVDVPVDTLISRAYGSEQRKRIDMQQACPGMPMPGKIVGYDPYLSPVIARDGAPPLPADTSIVSVIDDQGNALCCTPSDTSWDVPVVPGTGLAISSRGQQSWAVHGHPSCLAPGKRPRLTPNPCFAQAKGRWIMPFGTPGGDQQVQANLQFLLSHFEFGMRIQDAIEAPRLMTHSHPDSFAPHASSPGLLSIEGRVSESVSDGLSQRGHRVERLDDWTHKVAGIVAVKKDLLSGDLEGGADPRRTSRVMGW